jgi:hypothetical protein
MIQKAPLVDSNQHPESEAARRCWYAARSHAGRDRLAGRDEAIERHRLRAPVWIIVK